MFWRKKNQEDQIPWYRRRDYKGDLTEDEKRELDHFRWLAQQPGGKHPADHDLPEEVIDYISKLKVELHDARETLLMGRVLIPGGFGVFILWLGFFGEKPVSLTGFLFGVSLIVGSSLYYFREHKKLKDQLKDYDGIRKEWELNYIDD